MYVTDASFQGRWFRYTPSPYFKQFVKDKYKGQFSKNKRIRRKQFKRRMNEILDKALDNLVEGIRERLENKA
jgi:hypothetical protein